MRPRLQVEYAPNAFIIDVTGFIIQYLECTILSYFLILPNKTTIFEYLR
jgi:hypothetical protein